MQWTWQFWCRWANLRKSRFRQGTTHAGPQMAGSSRNVTRNVRLKKGRQKVVKYQYILETGNTLIRQMKMSKSCSLQEKTATGFTIPVWYKRTPAHDWSCKTKETDCARFWVKPNIDGINAKIPLGERKEFGCWRQPRKFICNFEYHMPNRCPFEEETGKSIPILRENKRCTC